MDILMLMLSCSLIQDDALVRSIMYVQSENYIYYVGDIAGEVVPQYPNTLADAEKAMEIIHRRGGKALIGLMGIPEDVALEYNLKPSDLFDPCINIHIGTSILSSIKVASENLKDARKNIIVQFSKTLGLRDPIFVDLVLADLTFFDKSSDAEDSALSQSPIDFQGINLLENNNIFLKNDDCANQPSRENQGP
jgi:hypothetical protein